MVKVTFTDGTTKRYRIGCKKLGYKSWHHMDYRPMFKHIARIIGVNESQIEHWRVV